MIPLPGSLAVKRSKKDEAFLLAMAREWLESEERSPGIHASDLLDERLGFFNHIHPQALSDRQITLFLVGKVLHAFVLGSTTPGGNPTDLHTTDTGSSLSSVLGITTSPDSTLDGVVRELKTSRSFYEPKDVERDLGHYIEQLLIYMADKQHTHSQLWVLYLNLKEDGKTAPQFRVFDINISQEDLLAITEYIKERVKVLENAISSGSPAELPLCREWKCGRNNCPFYDECKPNGRFGDPRFDGTKKVQGSKKAAK